MPIFLAGSRTLLCVVGPTYIERICTSAGLYPDLPCLASLALSPSPLANLEVAWFPFTGCILEIFTFLRMGGLSDRLTIIPIAAASDACDGGGDAEPEQRDEELLNDALVRFRAFEVSEAKCFDDSQRHHLLSVIEDGFGSFDVFNSIVRHAFANKLEQYLADSSTRQASLRSRSDTKVLRESSSRRALGARPSKESPGGAGLGRRFASGGAPVAPSERQPRPSGEDVDVEDVEQRVSVG